ncbi:MAG: glycosyl transferase group 1 [Benjaminiella poitrasii]|nr:MAG: glycosyl transferase group 1 [Benjaminiella poitrasii]
MRIGIITENFLPKIDGVTRTLGRLLEHLRSTGHEVIVLGPETNMEYYAGAKLFGTFGIPFFLYPELKFNFWRPKFTEALIEFQPDVIHLIDPAFLCPMGLAIIRRHFPHTPIVSSYHTNLALYCEHFGYGFLKSIMWKWNRYCHSSSRSVACPSTSTMSVLNEQHFKNVRVWPRGVDFSIFSPSRRSEPLRSRWMHLSSPEEAVRKTVLLYVGRVSFEKNIKLVIESYRGMNHTTCHLVLVGDGPAYKELQKYCLAFNIPVTFTGYLQGSELAEAYASADIFAFPSTTETFGQVVLEAMASGLPVVGIEAEGVKDLVENNRTGLLLNVFGLSVQEQQVKYRALLELLVVQRYTVLKEMSQRAIEVAKKYTWYEAMNSMVQIYQDAVYYSDDGLPISLSILQKDNDDDSLKYGAVTDLKAASLAATSRETEKKLSVLDVTKADGMKEGIIRADGTSKSSRSFIP